MKRMLFVWAAATLAAAPVYGQTAAPQGPATERQSETPSAKSDRTRLEADVRYLADDSLEGREAGTTGYALAAGYVAGQFAALGIKPAGNGGTYFQSVPMVSSRARFDGRAGLEIADGQGAAIMPEIVVGEDFFSFSRRGESVGEVEGELVFVGYGFAADGYEQDDFVGIDLTGKIAVVLRGAPANLNSEERAHFGSLTSQRLSERGAIGSILLFTPIEVQQFPPELLGRFYRSASMVAVQPDGTIYSASPNIAAAATILPALAEALFKGQPVSWEDVLAYHSGERATLASFEMGLTARITGEYDVSTSASPNVVGMIPGTDPAVADEYVVVTAHLDHIGMEATPDDGDDEISNGAVDNATGVAAMIEAARLLSENPGRRPVVFVALTAEEAGLVGSGYFARNPTLSGGKMVANINLDAPIVSYPFTDIIAFGAERSTLLPAVEAAAESRGVTLSPDPAPERFFFVRSDQYSFVEQGIPAVYLATGWANGGEAAEKDYDANHYHSLSDEASLIDFEQLGRFTDVNYAIIRNVANMAEKPVWKAGDFFAKTFGGEMAE